MWQIRHHIATGVILDRQVSTGQLVYIATLQFQPNEQIP